MAKTKTPFLSLGASGSVGESITAQSRGKATMLRQKPFPADPYSLPQAYQRWLYQDYAYLWTVQDQYTRRAYSAHGSQYHLTGLQYWMKYQLKNLPDIALMYHLDIGESPIAKDFGKFANDGTVIGASPTSGKIDGALSFDGLNDVVNIPIAAIQSKDMSLLWFAKATFSTIADGKVRMLGTLHSLGGNYRIRTYAKSPVAFYWGYGTGAAFVSLGTPSNDVWHHFAVTFNYSAPNTTLLTYLDGIYVAQTTQVGILHPPDQRIDLGYWMGSFFPGEIDHVIFYNRVLDATEIKRHSERSYQ